MKNYFDKLSNVYDGIYKSDKCIQENKIIYDNLSRIIKPEDRIMDIGCGTGFLLDLMGNKIDRCQYRGIDNSPGMLKVAKKKHPYYFFIENNAELVEICYKTTLVIALFSLYYMENINNIIEQIKDKKYFIVQPTEKRIESIKHSKIYKGVKCYHYHKNEICNIFKGSRILEIGRYYYISNEKIYR